MRSLRLTLAVTSISIICILCCSLVFALNPDEASVSLFWSSQTVYPGGIVSIRITFQSNSAEQLQIYRIGFHFDWMSESEFYTDDLSANPVTIPSYGTHIFEVVVQIPLNVSVGLHSYFFGAEGIEGLSASSFSWNSSSSTIQIHSIYEKIYSDLMPTVENKLNEAISANYESAEAQSLLQQAQTEYDNAQSSAGQGQWTEATSSLEKTSNYLDQVSAAEQKSDEQRADQQSLLFYLAIIAIVVIVVVLIIAVVTRKKRRQTDSVADQSLETIEEQS